MCSALMLHVLLPSSQFCEVGINNSILLGEKVENHSVQNVCPSAHNK